MALTATQQAWVLSNVESRIVTVEFTAFGDLPAVYISNEGWMPTIGPLYLGRILRPWTLTRSVGGQIVGGGRTVIGLGDIEVANADGELGWMEQDWHKRPVVIRWGDTAWLDIDDHIVIHNGFVDSLECDGLTVIIKLSDDREAFNVVWPRARYSANTTLDGTGVTDGLGEVKPMAHGNVINADTVLLQNAGLYYGVNYSEIENNFTFSADLEHADWTNSNFTITADAILAPNGLMAHKLEPTDTVNILTQDLGVTSDQRTVSFFARAVSTSVTVQVYSSGLGGSQLIDTNWTRLEYTATASSDGSHGVAVLSQVGNAIYITEMQHEFGATRGSFVHTAAHPVTIPDIVTVRDNGIELVEGGGSDWTEPFAGIVQIDNVVGKITADTESGTGLVEDVFVRLLNDVGVIKFDDDSTQLLPDIEVSVWSEKGRPMIDYIDSAVNAVGGVWYPDRSGTIFAGLLDIPQTPAWEFDQRDISGQIQTELVTLPVDSISVGVRQSWANQDTDSLGGGLDEEEKKLLSQNEVFIVASNDPTLETDEQAPDEMETIETLMRVQSEARTTGRTWQEMLSVKRELHKCNLLRGAGLIDLTSTIRIAHDDVGAFAGIRDEDGEYIVDEDLLRIDRGKDVVVLSLEESFPFGSVIVEGWA